ncbi:MAG TPA: DUF4870 domain-containing protein [Anaerolineales bacterium]|nr:DUF4870 domain-containing protein [Anaerolineales bacterium]
MNTSPTSDEKITAALVHGSVFLMFFGPIIPVLLWASQRKKSKFVSFHALQAMGYQALMFWLWTVAGILIGVLSVFLVFPLLFFLENSRNPVFVPFLFQIFIVTTIFGLMALFVLPGLIGAVYCMSGRDFRYPVLGKWLEHYLSYEAGPESHMDETHEENWVAGVCHATAILLLWGVVTPLIVWFTQKERSLRLRFQAMQAALYQAGAFIAYMLGMAVYMLFFFGMFFTLILGATTSSSKEIQGPAAVIMLIFLGVIIIFWFIMLILMPLYYLLAGFGSVRLIRGHNFRYPILGKMLEKRMEKSQNVEPAP